MRVSRRDFVGAGAAAAVAAAVPAAGAAQRQGRGSGGEAGEIPASLRELKPLAGKAVPISDGERQARIEKARRLMAENGVGAIVLEPGTSMTYFVNVRWGTSERPFLLVIPAKGELAYVTPGFEEQRARELTGSSKDVRVWQEDEDWGTVVAGILKDRGVTTGKVGIEERVRFFIADGLRAACAAACSSCSATPVTAGCRMIKSPAEIALMQRANDITIAAYKAAFATLHEGMTQFEFQRERARRVRGARRAWRLRRRTVRRVLGVSARQHHAAAAQGRRRRARGRRLQRSKGYQSDITRTTVFGNAVAAAGGCLESREAAQTAAFKAAQVGATCESVDAAARKVITDAGFGPGLQGARPAPPHRPRHRDGRPRVDQLRARQQDEAAARHVLQRRADDRNLRRVRHPPGGLPLHHRERRRSSSPQQSPSLEQPFL